MSENEKELNNKIKYGEQVLRELVSELRDQKFSKPEYVVAYVEGKLNAFISLNKMFNK